MWDEVTLYAYVLMPNHYHLPVKTPLTGKSQRDVGRYYGYGSESAVGKQRKLLAGLAAADARLAKRSDTLAGTVLRTDEPISTFQGLQPQLFHLHLVRYVHFTFTR